MKQKLLIVLMALLLPTIASAYDVCIDGIYYNIVKKAKQATVTYRDQLKWSTHDADFYTGDVVIPATIEYEGVTCNVIAIGEKAFNYSRPTSLTIPSSVRSIGKDAFHSRMDGLYISDMAAWCEIEYSGDSESDWDQSPLYYSNHFYLNGEEVIDLVIPDGVTKINSFAFCEAKMLKSAKLPESVMSIGAYAFMGCTGLQSVNIPEGITTIEKEVFANCGVSSFTIPNSVTSIGWRAFYNCENLKSLTIGNGITTIESQAFAYLDNLEDVYISDLKSWIQIWKEPSNNFSFGMSVADGPVHYQPLEYAKHLYLNGKEIKDLVIPEGVTSVPADAFLKFVGLTSATIPDWVESFAFSGCANMKTITVGNGTDKIKVYGCESLSDLEIGSGTSIYISTCNSLKKIATSDITTELKVEKCEKLETLVLGKSIQKCEISGCKELANVYCSVVPCFNSASFDDDCQIEFVTLHVPEIVLNDYAATEPWKKFGNIIALKNGDPGYIDYSDVIQFADSKVRDLCLKNWDTNGDQLLTPKEAAAVTDLGIVFSENKTITSFDELKYFTGLTAIGDKAFFNCSKLLRITIPANVKTIGDFAFNGCSSLSDVELPDDVSAIGQYGFAGCSSFTTLNIPKGVTKININTYADCEGIKEIIIPDHIVEIGNFAFARKSGGKITYEKVYIPSSVKTIGEYIFDYVEVKNVYVPDITTWWNSPFVGKDFCRIDRSSSPKGSFRLFANGSEVVDLVIPSDITTIPDNKFYGCTSLASLKFSGKVRFGAYAFQKCTGLTSVLIPIENKNDLGDGAFRECSNLTDVYLPLEKPFGINRGTAAPFSSISNNATLHVPEGSVDAYIKQNYWTYWFSNIVALQEGDPGYEKPKDGVTLMATSYCRVYGNANPTFEYTIVDGTITSGTPTITCSATVTSPVGTYDIIIAKGTVSNSMVNLVNGTLTITKTPLTITAKSYTIKQGDALPTFEATYSGFKNNETSSVLTAQPVFSCSVTSSSVPGTYDIIVKDAAADNYEISYAKGTLTITPGIYKLTYLVDGAEYKSYQIEYGAAITPEAAPTKEGYTFSGWSEIPSTMPAKDVTVTGTFAVNKYKLTYMVDGNVYKTVSYDYGATITPEAEPTKEGYTFSGWSNIPATMPAQDVTVTGTFTKGAYKLIYMVDGELYKTISYEYGATITPEAEPTKEGYTFSGWSEIPSTMPAQDVTVTGTFTINKYMLVYMVDGIEYKSYEVEYGATITPETEPTKEGYTFSGWSNIPATMPAQDVTVTGTFTKGAYKLIYMVDGELYKTISYDYGATITPEAEPTKEGYTFSGWSEIPSTMPAQDVTVTGTFTINKYMLVYMVDGIEYKSYEVEYGATITPEAEPTKEGHTFSGWSNIPATMPAQDVTVTGTFTKAVYKLIYMVDGELYKTISYEYGATITPEAEPTKEGYTFSGWSEIPSTMPAQDVTVTGTFTINKYMLVYMVDGIEYKSYEVEYGATITPETEPTKEGYTFSGWSNIPATMPAQDVTVTGTFTQVVFTIDKVTYEITDEGTVIIKGSDQRGEVIIEVTIKINGQTYQVTAIADNAFKKNENITSLTIPAGITTIGDNAFEGCSGLFVINIGKDVQSIGNKAFANVGTATGTRTRNEESTIVVNCYTESVPQTAWNAFENTPIETGMLFVDDNLKDAFKSTSPWSRFGKIIGFEEAVGIKSISIDTDNARIYDMQGNRLDNVRKGMNIIRTEDGKIKKVMVK